MTDPTPPDDSPGSSGSTPELRALLALQLTSGVGPRVMANLLERFGSASAALQARLEDLLQVPLVGPRVAQAVREAARNGGAEEELARIRAAGVALLVRGTSAYPACLVDIPDAPYLLYCRGGLLPADSPAVALVGSRSCSDYGLRTATRLATGLARAGVTVVSGLAYGIDAAAHRASLQAGGRTLAVLAGGLARIYPREHKGLAEEVVRAGALLSESRLDQEPLAGLFPARNRIISGLCQAVVIVEAAERSGALHTARHAAEQGRTVLAVPGAVDGATSGGCHALLRQGAVLCRSVDDVLEEVRGVSWMATEERAAEQARKANDSIAPVARKPAPAPAGAEPPTGLDEPQRRVWEFLGGGSRAVDEVARHLGMAVGQLSGVLLTLEMKKIVKRLPGNRYERW
jgi:DNA processing protein